MYDTYSDLNLRTLLHLKRMREEALELYDYCLAEGNVGPMIHFIEEQIAADPPPLLLLYEIADDIQQRFLSLRENHFDVRHQVLQALHNLYQIDIDTIIPHERLERLEADEIIELLLGHGASVNDDEQDVLRRLIDQSRETAVQLKEDIRLTASVQEMVMDWVSALATSAAREYTVNLTMNPPTMLLH